MITFEIKKNLNRPGEFSYDLKALAQSFYPEKPCQVVEREDWVEEEGYPLRCILDEKEILNETLPGNYTKNTVKALVYKTLEHCSGRSLPWGILTGIRPAKIPLRMKMQGESREAMEQVLQEEYLVNEAKTRLAVDVAEKEYERTKGFDHEKGYNIYIGIPFCPSICQYCSFSSYDIRSYKKKVDDYLSALEKEMKYTAETFGDYELHTVYVGGGTPTSLNPEQLKRLMEMIHKYLPMSETAEFTVEAGRPDSITREKLEVMQHAGVTRISINPQTMKQRTLDLLGRKHTVEQIQEVYAMAKEMGFDNINMDLIVGLPEETEEDFTDTLQKVCDMEPDSVTVHTLVIKRASRMRREQLEQGGEMHPEDELIAKLQYYSEDFLREKGYEPYYMYRQKNKAGTTRNTNQENVAYARPGKECLYNIFIMEEKQTIVAIGAGTISKRVYPDGRIERCDNVKDVAQYIERIEEMIERKKELYKDS